jgi:exosortase K
MNSHRIKNHVSLSILVYCAAALVAVALKYHYSHASSDDLLWILAPTASIVSWITGVPYLHESGTGFVSPDHRFIIAPACSGVNFMIIAFCTALFSFAHRFRRVSFMTIWLAASLSGAYLVTLCVSSLRIILSIALLEHNVRFGWFTPERIHRIEGIAVYLFTLIAYYSAILSVVNRAACDKRGGRSNSLLQGIAFIAVPVCWYVAVTVGVPLITGHSRAPYALFKEHIGMVLLSCIAVSVIALCIQLCFRRKAFKIGGTNNHDGRWDETESSDRGGRAGHCRHDTICS